MHYKDQAFYGNTILGMANFQGSYRFVLCYHSMFPHQVQEKKTTFHIPKKVCNTISEQIKMLILNRKDEVMQTLKTYPFQIYFKRSQNLVLCSRDYWATLVCRATLNSDPNNYFTNIYKVDHPELYFTISDAPNGKDVWLSGGLGYELGSAGFGSGFAYTSVYLDQTITMLK